MLEMGGAPTWYVIGVIICLVIAFCCEGRAEQKQWDKDHEE